MSCPQSNASSEPPIHRGLATPHTSPPRARSLAKLLRRRTLCSSPPAVNLMLNQPLATPTRALRILRFD